jgi:hypothetical protein
MTDAPKVRDGVPTPDEIRQAAQLLQIPLHEERMGIEAMTPQRQVTSLLAVLSAWITAYEFVHDIETDRLTPDEMHMLVTSAQTEVTGGDPAAAKNAAIWHIQWAGYLNAELGRGGYGNASSPVTAIENLLRAAARILTSWRDADAGFELDGTQYRIGDAKQVQSARKDTVAALSAINKLLGPS